MKKKIILNIVITLILFTMLIGCKGKIEIGTTKNIEKSDLKVSLVIAGELGDGAFYDSSYEGLRLIERKYKIESIMYECKNIKGVYEAKLKNAARNSDVVLVAGYQFYDVLQIVAKDHKNVKFVYIDNIINGVPNITCVDYKENEGAFLIGALAALETKTGKIGMIGGIEIPVIENFKIGFIEGAKYINENIEVEVDYVGSFNNPSKAKRVAQRMYSEDFDIIFQVANKSGIGVFEAAKDAGKYAIGVDADQRSIDPDVIMASMTKGVAISILETVERIQSNTFVDGSIYEYGVKERGVGISYGSSEMKQIVSEKVKSKIDEITDKIVKSEIEIGIEER